MLAFVDFEFHFSKASLVWFDGQNTDPKDEHTQLGKKQSLLLLVTLLHYFKQLPQHTLL